MVDTVVKSCVGHGACYLGCHGSSIFWDSLVNVKLNRYHCSVHSSKSQSKPGPPKQHISFHTCSEIQACRLFFCVSVLPDNHHLSSVCSHNTQMTLRNSRHSDRFYRSAISVIKCRDGELLNWQIPVFLCARRAGLHSRVPHVMQEGQ